MTLKSKLLNPKTPKPVETDMFGDRFLVQVMTTAQITTIDKKMTELRGEGDPEAINNYTLSVILDSMVDDKGASMSKTVSPDSLLNLYGPAAISSALNAVYEVNYSNPDGADKAKKD